MNKKILVLGANGMLGSSLHRHFSRCDQISVVGTVRSEQTRQDLANMGFENTISGVNTLDEQSLIKTMEQIKPDYVFNCIGLIKQLSASKLPIPAIEINSLLPHRLASLCTTYKCKLIHFSTDCVFSGKKGMYTELDTPDADDIYGRSKLLGEVGYDGHLTLRTSIIGHELNSNASLIDWFLSQHGTVKGFSKAVFSGLPTCYIAEFVEQYIFSHPELSGVYHLSVDPIDKYTLLSLVKEIYGVDTTIEDYSDFSIDRSLNSDRLREAIDYTPPAWDGLIKKMYDEYCEYFATHE